MKQEAAYDGAHARVLRYAPGGAIRRPDLDRWPWGSVHHYELPLGIQSSFYALLHSRSLRLLAMKSFSLCAAHRVKCLELLIHGLGFVGSCNLEDLE